jgi:lysophospholipase L1-like esterase
MRERILAVGLGTAIALLVLELALRVAGALYGNPDAGRLATADIQAFPTDATVVLCAGDSMTHGTGARAGFDYPAQLQRRLEQISGDHPVVVINGGVGGANSTMLLEQLPAFLEALRPDWVTLLIGTTNRTNYYGFHHHVGDRSLGARLDDLLFHVRVYRLVRYAQRPLDAIVSDPATLVTSDGLAGEITAFTRWTLRSPGAAPLPPAFDAITDRMRLGQFEDAVAVADRALAGAPDEPALHWARGTALRALHRSEEADEALREHLRLAPDDPNAYHALGVLHLDDPFPSTVAQDWFEAGVVADPEFAGNYWGLGLVATKWSTIDLRNGPTHADWGRYWFQTCVAVDPHDARCYSHMTALARDAEAQQEMITFLRPHARASEVAADHLYALEQGLDHDAIARWVRSDVEQMIDLAEASGARVVMQDYPYPDIINQPLRDLAVARGLTLASQRAAFEQSVIDGTAIEDLFAADGGHCNDAGYAVMAGVLAAALEQAGLLGPGLDVPAPASTGVRTPGS